jgi:predicted dehydrogenase
MSQPIKLGVLAASRIATKAVIEPAATVDGVEITAVGARTADRAAEAAQRWGVEHSYGSYQDLIDSDVDAIYLATPASLHRPWAVATLEAGKHLLCEKPLAANADDAAVIAAAAESAAEQGVVAMEAFHWRYHPMVSQIRSVLESGELGQLIELEARFDIADGRIGRSDIRWDLPLGGGALMDLGCYPVQWLRFVGEVIGAGEPTVVSAAAHCPVEGIDGQLEAVLNWSSGLVGRLHTSMVAELGGADSVSELIVRGQNGTMIATNPLAPQSGASMTVESDQGVDSHEVAESATYWHQLVAFRDAINQGTPFPTTMAGGVANMVVIDACYRAAGLEPRPTHDD